MANQPFNVVKGKAAKLVLDNPNSIVLLLLKTAEADATLIDYDTVASILAGSNVEADFTNYARKTGIVETVTVDDTNNRVTIDIPNQTFVAAGGASNNTTAKAILAVATGVGDANLIPLSHHDCVVTTDGTDLLIEIPSTGFYLAT